MAGSSTSRDTRSARQVSRKAIPLEKDHVHYEDITANDDILASDLTPSDAPCLFRIMVQMDTAAVFSAMVDDGANEVTLEFNAGAQLTAGALHMFDMLVHSGDLINFQADQNAKLEKLIVQEVLWAVQ